MVMYINIGNSREVLWDDYLIDNSATTAKNVLHQPIKREQVYVFDQLGEKRHVSYPHCIKIDDEYIMYYVTSIRNQKREVQSGNDLNKLGGVTRYICILKGTDPFHLERPNLGICEVNGSCDNNVILKQTRTGNFEEEFDNIFVFVDENPDCPPEEKVKGVVQTLNHDKEFPGLRELWCYTSPDGIHFKRGWKIAGGDEPNAGIFDSLNIAWYDQQEGIYKAFVRGIHKNFEEGTLKDWGIRDVRYMESKDFKTWSEPKLLNYGEEADDYALYTNQIQRYYRAPHMYVGFPTRYIDRKVWGKNLDQIGGDINANRRREIAKRDEPRSGIALTDCIFMSSRDGLNWNRWDEMFLGPGIERDDNWFYGDCYPMYNLFETPSEYAETQNDISMLMHEGQRSGEGTRMYRYSIRLDGFASYHADYRGATLTTKPFIFSGQELSINFETSALGFVYVDVLDESGKAIEGYRSCELFGNTTDRAVYFGETSDVSKLSGLPVKLRFTMRDADIYSFIFR